MVEFEEVVDLVRKAEPLAALDLIKRKGPEDIRNAAIDLLENPIIVTSLDEKWRDLLLLIYFSYFSLFVKGTDNQSIAVCAHSSLNAAKLSRKMGLKELEGISLSNAARTLLQMSMTEQAEKCYCEAEKILKKVSEKDKSYLKKLGDTLNDLGVMYLEAKKEDEAEKRIVEALEIRRELSTMSEEHLVAFAETLSNAGALYGEKREYDKSEKYYSESEAIFREIAEKMLHIFHILQ
jgi:tetratricopeptide (TPR) repeat protein